MLLAVIAALLTEPEPVHQPSGGGNMFMGQFRSAYPFFGLGKMKQVRKPRGLPRRK